MPDDSAIVLAAGRWRAVVAARGAGLRRYYLLDATGAELDVVWGYSRLAEKKGGQGDVLIPFPGRVANGRYAFEGQPYQLPCNDKEGPNAIHGFLRAVSWEVERLTASAVTFATAIVPELYADVGYPFALEVHLRYELELRQLGCTFTIRNVGCSPAPVGVGFHPYLTVGTPTADEAVLMIPASRYLEFTPTLTPTGRLLRVEDGQCDYRDARRIGAARLNHCFLDLARSPADGLCRAQLAHPDGSRTLTVAMDSSFTALVVYTGDAIMEAPRRAVAIEPMTCATDAFNHPEWGLKRLEPGECWSGTYWLQPQLAAPLH